MRHFSKETPPAEFEAWKARTNDDWQPSYSNLQNPEKKKLHEALLNEQRGVCCYCGRSISIADSHIEHFRPQEHYESLALNYENLFASCIREKEPGNPLHCGHAKENSFDEEKHISPLDPTCEGRFAYTPEGAILPAKATDENAKYMSNLLKLDIEFLQNRRAEVLQQVFDAAFLDSATTAELERLAQAYRATTNGGRVSFGHVVARYAEQLLERPI